jgi:hypothetical protein
MVISVDALSTPVGAIKSWIRPDNTTPLPFGWLICDGSVVVDSESPFNGKTLPDKRGRFPRGHATLDNSNFASDTLYYTGGTVPTGGADSKSLSHAHTTSSHDHSYGVSTSSSSSIGGVAGGPTATLANGVHNHSFSGTTNSSGITTNASLGATENRPAYVETVTIIKVK